MKKTINITQKEMLLVFALLAAFVSFASFAAVAQASPYEYDDDDRYEYKYENKKYKDYDDDYNDDDRYEYRYKNEYKKYDDDKYEYQNKYQNGYHEKYLGVADLPASAQKYLQDNYPNVSVVKVEKEYNRYEVKLSNGVELYFNLQGVVTKDEGKKYQNGYKEYYGAANAPQVVKDFVAKNYPNAQIIKVEKKYNRYEVKLSNGVELYLNEQGQLIRKEYENHYKNYQAYEAQEYQNREKYQKHDQNEYGANYQNHEQNEYGAQNQNQQVSQEQISKLRELLEQLLNLLSFWR